MTRLPRWDALVIGAGHNGLVCACYLARAGLRVRMVERRMVVGGAAVTEEFAPGFRNSTASYTVGLLHPKIIADLNLHAHGLRIVERGLHNFLPLPDGDCFSYGGLEKTQTELARFSRADAQRLPAFNRVVALAADLVRGALLKTPPDVGRGGVEWLRALLHGRALALLPGKDRADVLQLLTGSAGSLLDAWFESDVIKAVLGFDAVVGSFTSPYAPGSSYVLLHHALGGVNGKPGTWGHAIGGMGAITQAMAREAQGRGVEITTGRAVARLRLKRGRATGVTLEDGEEIEARCVAAGLNPKLLFLNLVDDGVLDEAFLRRMRAYRCRSGSLRMNVALSELPDFTCRPGKLVARHHTAGIIFAPSLAYMEAAYADATGSGWSRRPIVEMLIPSTLDETLAPPGRHVASLFCQHFNPDLPAGTTWDEVREQAAECVIDAVTEYAPNFRASILARQLLTPLDLERQFALVGGDIFHGCLTPDQLYWARPTVGAANYRTPIPGLYLCGSGAHPGGGVTGIPGHNAAREMLRDLGRRQ